MQRLGSAGFMGGIVGFGAGTATSAVTGIGYNSHLNSFANDMIQSRPGAVKKLIKLSEEIKSPAIEKMRNSEYGVRNDKGGITVKNVGDMIDSVIGQMLAEKGSKANVIRSMYILEGRDADFITSREASAVADSIIRFAAGKATKADVAVLEQSRSAAMVLDVLEANSDAKKAVASQMRNSEYGMQNDRSATSGVKYKYAGETKSGIKKYVTDFPADMDSGARKKVFEERIATIFNLGAVKLNTDTKKIQIMGDKFVSEKNLYGDKKSSDLEMDAKVNSLYDIAEILSESKFMGKEIEPSFKDAEVKPKNKAHKGVKYWYYFKNTIYMDDVLYDVFFDIRDKGKEQYQYSIRFVEKNRTTRSGHTADNNLRRKTNESSSTTRVSQNEGSVNTQSMQEGELYSQGKEVIIPEKARIAKNIILDEESSAFRTKNGKGYKVIEMMAQDLRKKVKFVKGLTDEDGNVLDGVITDKGIIINTEGKNPVKWAATHEFSHRMKQSAEKSWAKYQQYVVKATKKDGTYNERFKLKAKAYKTTDEAYINEEIAADYIGELFDDVDSLADFIRESRSEAIGIRNFWYNILDRLGLHGEKRKAQALWSKAYKKAMQNVKDGKVGEYSGEKLSIQRIVGEKEDYGIGVYLDSKVLSGLSENKRIEAVKNHVKSIGGRDFIAYDDGGKPIHIHIAEHSQRYENKNGAKIRVNNDLTSFLKNEVKQESVVLIDELITSANYKGSEKARYSHGWLDDYGKNDWDYWKVYIQEKNKTVWEATLNIANSANGEKILYDIYPIEMVEQAGTSATSTTKAIVPQDTSRVNTYSMQNGGNNTQKKSVTGTRLSGAEDLDTEQADGGFIPPGAEPRRDVKVPKSVQKGTKVRQFPRTAAEAETLSDETTEGVLDNVEKGKFNYTPLSDKSAMKNAYATIDTMGGVKQVRACFCTFLFFFNNTVDFFEKGIYNDLELHKKAVTKTVAFDKTS